MRKLIEYDHVSIDGGMSGDAWWAGRETIGPNDNHFAYQLGLLSSAVGLVLGRVTYQGFAETWPTSTGDVADKINSLPKYVASTTLTETTWNAEVLTGDPVAVVAQLKDAGDGTLVKYGNGPYAPEPVVGHQDVGGAGRYGLLNLGGPSVDGRRESI